MHPADEIRGSKTNFLKNKKVVLAVTGSIAAVECVKLSRELIRHGAKVYPVMTKAACNIIHPDALWFATGNKPIVKISGETEHVKLCGQVKNPADLLLICPCTANTISKISHGIDDSSVTTFATTAIGSGIPMVVVPAMHVSMYNHKIVQQNIKKCKQNNIQFIGPKIIGNKAKIAGQDEIVAQVVKKIGPADLADKKILIIGGANAEKIDDIRFISNRSSGKTAVWLAKNAFYRGANVELWYGKGTEKPPGFINTKNFTSLQDLIQLLKQSKHLKKFDLIFICAALSDYIPETKKGKIPSGKKDLTIKTQTAPKFIPLLKKKNNKAKLIAFKAEEKKRDIAKKAASSFKKYQLDFVVANTIRGFEKDINEIWIYDKNNKSVHKKGKKQDLTNFILNTIK